MSHSQHTGSVPRDARQGTDGRLLALLVEAIDYQAAAFDQDEPVDGGDLVEWFALWRLDARAVLADPEDARRHAAATQE